MAANVLNMFRVEDLRNKVLFTLGMIFIYRLGCFVPAPGIDIDAIQLLKETTDENGGALAFLRLFSGGVNSVRYLRIGDNALHYCFNYYANPWSRYSSC